MFEEYLEDADYFMKKAAAQGDSQLARRYYRASIFCAMSAIEAFVNYVGDAFAAGGSLEPYEIAFLMDKQSTLIHGKFEMLDTVEYHRLEDKLRFLICKFSSGFDFHTTTWWGHLLEFKKFRDSLVHPRQDEDETELDSYKSLSARGLSSVIEAINHLCIGIFRKPLRKKLLELRVENSSS